MAQLVETNKMEAIRQYWRAREHFERGNLGLALRAAKRATELEADYPQAFFLIGLIEKSRGDTVAALAAYRRTIALNADYSEAYVNIANLYLGDQMFDSAIQYYRAAISHNRELDQAYFNLAETLHALERDTDAIAVYEVMIQVKPDKFIAYYNIACIYALAGDRAAALEWFNRGVAYMDEQTLDNALRDADLQLLRDDGEFKRIIEVARETRRAGGQR